MNVLTDQLFSIITSSGHRRMVSLPDLLVEMQADQVTSFPALRPHQAPAWHMFLVQLATLALQTHPAHSADEWRRALRALTPDWQDDEPWCMTVADWSQPAFLQPPLCDESNQGDYKRLFVSADELDVLVTGRNHDLKVSRMKLSQSEEWLYALLTLQTMGGFLGAGNYGIARMNRGFASRALLHCVPDGLGPGGHVFRDVAILVERYDDLMEHAAALGVGRHQSSHRLLWLAPWDGSTSLSLDSFHPLAIEICRRVRLRRTSDTSWIALSAGSKVARTNADDACGVVGDPWSPIKLEGNKSLTVGEHGFGYRQMVDLMDPKRFRWPLLAHPTRSEARGNRAMVLRAFALARGKGKTEGFHERCVFLPPRSTLSIAHPNSEFLARAAAFVSLATSAAGKALRPALIQLVQGKKDLDWNKPSNDSLIAPWLQAFDARVDRDFFPILCATLEAEMGSEVAEAEFSKALYDHASAVFRLAALASPRTDQLRVLAQARALTLLESSLRKHLPSLRSLTGEAAK